MKKIVSLLLVVALCFGLCACGTIGNNDQTGENSQNTQASEAPTETTAAATEATTSPASEETTSAAPEETTAAPELPAVDPMTFDFALLQDHAFTYDGSNYFASYGPGTAAKI